MSLKGSGEWQPVRGLFWSCEICKELRARIGQRERDIVELFTPLMSDASTRKLSTATQEASVGKTLARTVLLDKSAIA